MPDKMIVLQFTEHDVYQLLYLVQNQAVNGLIYNDYWHTMSQEMMLTIHAQQNGHFFQCAACHEEAEHVQAG